MNNQALSSCLPAIPVCVQAGNPISLAFVLAAYETGYAYPCDADHQIAVLSSPRADEDV
ncbi:MAG: hypothetical protein [Bacteriophage sp.]|nr:MAG: hypothetical protein [Bacteriophage sp.]